MCLEKIIDEMEIGMKKNFHESYTEGKIELPSDKSTGLVFAAVCLLAAYLLRHSQWGMGAAIITGISFASASFLKPTLLRPLNILWFRLSLLLNRIVSPVIMGVLFFLVILPFGLIMRIWRDPLLSAPGKDRETYWVKPERSDETINSMKNQF